MEKNEIKSLAATISANAKSANDIKGQYKVLAEKYGKVDARIIVDLAKEMRSKILAKVEEQKANILTTIDKKALEWNFNGLLKDREYKALANRALCKCADVVELVAKWYPHTIDGEPARKVEGENGRVWAKTEKVNPQACLKACLRNMAKAAKGAKAGTIAHTEGEPCPKKEKKNNK